MKQLLYLLAACTTANFAWADAEEAAQSEVALQEEVAPEKQPEVEKDVGKISRAFGHIIGQNLESLGLEFDFQQVIAGIQENLRGETSPLNEQECIQAISLMQENAFQKKSDENLQAAEEFLAKNAKEQDVISLEEGRLQYILLAPGDGEEVKEHDSPKIRYTGKFLDGKVFGESQDDEVISLDDTIAGFSKTIVGMREGEKRRIFIHPDLGYGKAGFLPPNSLLTFEIEVVKANSPKEEEEPALSAITPEGDVTDGLGEHAEELASTDAPQEGTR